MAIVITFMVLEMEVPHGADFNVIDGQLPVFYSYVPSFVNVARYWNNHHHLLYTVEHTDARIMWANIRLLFWLTSKPFATAWMGENDFAAMPTALYGFVLLAAADADYVLLLAILASHGQSSTQGKALGHLEKPSQIS